MIQIHSLLLESAGWAVLHSLWQITLIMLILIGALYCFRNKSAAMRGVITQSALALMFLSAPINFFWLLMHAVPAADSRWAFNGLEALPGRAFQPHSLLISWLYSHAFVPALLWAAGTGAALFLLAADWLAARQFLQRCIPSASTPLNQLLCMAENRLGCRQQAPLLWSSEIDTPATAGIVRPAVILPAGRLNGLSSKQLELLMLHELAHIQRHDALRISAAKLAVCFLFFHPAAWYALNLLQKQCEECCDAMVVAATGARNDYVRTLAEIENRRSLQTFSVLAGNGGELLQRIRALIGKETDFPYPKFIQQFHASLLLLTIFLLPPCADHRLLPGGHGGTYAQMPAGAAHVKTTVQRPDHDADHVPDNDDLDHQDKE